MIHTMCLNRTSSEVRAGAEGFGAKGGALLPSCYRGAIAVAALLLLVPVAQAGQSEPTLRLVGIYGGAAALDELSTEYALHNNPYAREGNVLLRSRPLRVGAHVGVTALETWATQKLQRDGHPGWARALKWGVVAKAVVAGVINIRAARAR